MQAIIRAFIELCLLRRGPQDLPASQALLIASGALLVVTAVISDQLNAGFDDRLMFALAQIGLLTVIVWAILTFRGKPERVPQTLTAFYGSGVLIQVLVWPFRAWLLSLEDQQQGLLPLLAIVAFAIWSFVIMIHIYRNALETTTGPAILVSLLTQLLVGMSVYSLFDGLQP